MIDLPKNQLLEDVRNMSKQSRAALLLQSTLLRLALESDDPRISDILLDPASHPNEDSIAVWKILIGILTKVQKERKAAEEGFPRIGMSFPMDLQNKYSEQVNACYVWLQTVGARHSHVPMDSESLWNYLREGVPYLSDAINALKEEDEVAIKLRLESGSFLNGLAVDRVLEEAARWPVL
jgi:hypothetical protein